VTVPAPDPTTDAEGALLCIIPGPNVEIARQDAGVRWCFGCRKHLPHVDILFDYDEPSYYDPVWSRKCSRCHQDRTTFPGGDLL
jgi:hypothetical protein